MSLSHLLNPGASPISPVGGPPSRLHVVPPKDLSVHSRSPSLGDSPIDGPNPDGRPAFPSTGTWDSVTGEWISGQDVQGYRGGRYKDYDSSVRKRRKIHVDDGDSDYVPPGQNKSPAKRRSLRTRQVQPIVHPEDLEPGTKLEDLNQQTEQEFRLALSDLDECPEIWTDALDEYISETRKRDIAVEEWFLIQQASRNVETARELSKFYSERLLAMPPPVPEPPVPSHVANRRGGHDIDTLLDFAAYPTGHDRNGEPMITFEPMDMASSSHVFQSVMPMSTSTYAGKGKGRGKRVAAGNLSDGSSDLEVPSAFRKDRKGPTSKKRKMEQEASDIADEFERTFVDETPFSMPSLRPSAKGKGKQRASPEPLMTTEPSASSKGRKRPGPKKKAADAVEAVRTQARLDGASAAGSADVTPSPSRGVSPAPSSTAFIFDLDETIPPLRKAKKMDDATMIKRVTVLEEAQRKVWLHIARKDVAKVYRFHSAGYNARQSQLKRLATVTAMQPRRPFLKTSKSVKDVQTKAKRLMREMLVFWKKNEREERDVRKREHREALDRAKEEDEKREAARQARKLEFLISQTELYSHFVGNKLKTSEMEGDVPVQGPASAPVDRDIDPESLKDIDFDDEDETNMHRHAAYQAQEAIALAKQRALEFDSRSALDRKTSEALALANGKKHSDSDVPLDLDSDELNFQNPTSLTGPLTVEQPLMLMAQLKEYQLKGLNWLATLYEQGINGILADEMGLGKTVQSISLLAHLVEKHDIWGPFLVVAPASTLHNWQQEITRFVPKLKALPYWGNVKDRAILRKVWSRKEISYDQDAPFHVLITSYQLVTQDQQYFQRVRWQYMVLDEAQNIKNSASVRWKTLLGFQCRNRLLLTGTPIQNNMQELWALLHFIMPTLFDSHDEFNEWFSKDIENAAENKGSKLNEHQLRRLHMILKPFMLRRVKRHVQNELSEKIEIDIYVDLSARQRAMYRKLRADVSVTELLEKAANIGDADSARSLMNLVMQFRKVCNHPELFERADVVAPFSFCEFGSSSPTSRDSEVMLLQYSTRNPISFCIPALFYLDGGLLSVPTEKRQLLSDSGILRNLLTIWSTDWIKRSLEENTRSPFCFIPLLDSSIGEVHTLHHSPLIRRRLLATFEDHRDWNRSYYAREREFVAHAASSSYKIWPVYCRAGAEGLPLLQEISRHAWKSSCLSRPGLKWHVPPVVAPALKAYCSDRTFLDSQDHLLDAPLETLALYGSPDPQELGHSGREKQMEGILPGVPFVGLMANSPLDQLPLSCMQVPEAKRLVYDSAKLARLDSLLHELKAGDHRVLVYFQMTRMMDLMEEYLIYRQFKYLRLDGSSKLEDRRDMVIDWQTRSDIFVFLLSTRAGGLGINLTAADTVVFYDHDWNPSNDAQAMDRAHRLGQTRQVTVYRLITKGTIDERIIQLARVKKDVQDIVVGNKSLTDVAKPSEIVSLLLNEDEMEGIRASSNMPNNGLSTLASNGQSSSSIGRDLWNEEGDDFFGHSAGNANTRAHESEPYVGEEPPAQATPSGRGRGRGGRKRGSGSTRGRKSGKRGAAKD